MEEVYKFTIGITLLTLGIPTGNILAKATKEELKSGQKWFKILIIASLIGAITSLILGNDALLFTFLWIGIVTSRSLWYKNNKKHKKI